MFQYIKNSFIRNVKDIQITLLWGFIFLIVYYMNFYPNYNQAIKSFNIFSIISHFTSILFNSYEKFLVYIIIDNIIQIVVLFFIFLTAIFNRLIYKFPWQLLFSYLIILGIYNNAIVNKLDNLFHIVNIFFLVLFIPVMLFALERNYFNNQQYTNKNILIEFIIKQLQKHSSDKYIIALIDIALDVICFLFLMAKYYYLKIFLFDQISFIINLLVIIFLYRMFFLNCLLLRNIKQIAQNKIAIFETSEYQGFIKTNKLLINENFIFSIAFVYIIAFIYHYSLVYEYLYCILIAVPIILIISTFKKNQVNKNLIL